MSTSHPRGIYSAQWQVEGHEVLLVVDSHGDTIGQFIVRDSSARRRVTGILSRLLDELDPVGWQAEREAKERRSELTLLH